MDGFESGGSDLWNYVNGSIVSASKPAAFSGTYYFSSGASGSVQKTLSSSKTELYMAFKIYYNTGSVQDIIYFKDSAGTAIASLERVVASSFVNLRRGKDGGSGATIIATGTIPLGLSTVHLIEIYYKPLNSGGVFTTKINGVQDINYSGDSTNGLENIQTFSIGAFGDNANIWVDDVVVDDANWIGNTKIQALVPTGAGATSQHTAVINAHPVVLAPSNNSVAGPYVNFRTIIKSSYITQSGAKIKVGLRTYSSIYNFSVVSCSIGVRDGSTSDFSSAPTRITFGGLNSFTLIASTAINWSDWIIFNLTAGVDHLVHLYCSGATVYYGVDTSVSETGYIESNADANDTDSLSISGYSSAANRRYSVVGLYVEKTDGSLNYSSVNEKPAVDTDYIKTSSSQIDTYAMENLSGSIASIKSVAVQTRNWREGNGSYDRGQHIVRPASTDRLAASKTTVFPPSAISFQSIWELNPEDSAAWEEADVNGMEAGIKAVTA